MAKKKTSTNKAVEKVKEAVTSVGSVAVKNPNTALYVGAGVLAIAGLYVLTKWTRRLSDFNLGNKDGAGGGNNDINGNSVPFGASISPNQAQNIAAALYEEMVKFWGTDGQVIIDRLRGLRPKDFAMISEAFGEPRYDGHGEALWPFPERPLAYWINSELNDREIEQLKLALPGVF